MSKLKLIPNLERSKAICHINRKTIPHPSALDRYRCTLVSEQYKDQFGQTSEINYLQFIPKAKGQPFKVNISDVCVSSTAHYQLMWSESFREDGQILMGDSVGLSIAVNCLDYLNPTMNISSNGTQGQLRKEITIASEQSELQSIFGSDEENLGGEKQPSVSQKMIKSTPVRPQKPLTYRQRDERNMLDYTQTTKISVMRKVIQFLKIKENRKKKLPEIRNYLLTQKFNVPEKGLKEIISTICFSPIMDRQRGYLLKDQYLTYEEIEERKIEEEKLKCEHGIQQRKKRGKKDRPEFSSPFEEIEGKKRKKGGKKQDRDENIE